MKLKEQLQKIIDDLEKLERKKDKFMEEYEEKKKKNILKKKDLEEKIRKEKDEKILKAISESFGDINEKNMDVFLELLKKNKEEFSLEMEIASEESTANMQMPEKIVPNFGTQETAESDFHFNENEV